ncbi:MAG TPA: hypothetical protein VHH34_24615 [Pseudonocardiaceae bacterium]|nr:hypothetical protein [Pseudonocardiaceae bacterium]
MNRVLNVARIQLVNAPVIIGMPWLILGLAFAANLAIFGTAGGEIPSEGHSTGALMSIYIVVLITQLQTMTQVFPFALGLSVTRRTFFAATSLVVTLQALGYGIVLYLLLQLERATEGWGLSLNFYGLPFLLQDDPVLQVLVYAVPLLFLSFLGVALGVVFKRWGQLGLYVLGAASIVLVGGLAALATMLDWWPALGRFLADRTALGLLVGYPLVLAVLIATTGYLLIRRATA